MQVTVHVASHTQVLARCPKLNNLKGSILLSVMPVLQPEVGTTFTRLEPESSALMKSVKNVSKKIQFDVMA